MDSPPHIPTGAAVIRSHLKTLPGSPGVYRMIDGAGAATPDRPETGSSEDGSPSETVSAGAGEDVESPAPLPGG